MSTRALAPLLLLAAAVPAAETLTITADQDPPATSLAQPADPAAALRDLPGVDGIRMGGTGLDPVMRGQSASRLLVEVDGACPQGGCPNRMDPPTTYAPAGADQARVEAGGLSVRHPGAPLGVITLDRQTPVFADGRWHEATAEARAGSNGAPREGGAGLALGGTQGFVQGRFAAATAEDYQDGDGADVASSYTTKKGGGTVGWTPAERTSLDLSYDVTRERDVRYAGANMDAPRSDGATTSLRLHQRQAEGLFALIKAEAYTSRVEHEMDHYSLRPATGMLMQVPSTSASDGGRAAVELRLPLGRLGLGVDGRQLAQDARRYQGTNPAAVATLNSVMWPDIRQRQIGAWSDYTIPVGERFRLVPGLRLDRVDSRAGDTAIDPPGAAALSPDALYGRYYGAVASERSEHLFGAALRNELDCGEASQLALALSRQRRAADPTERFMAANGATPAQRWVGNPGLEAETHWLAQIDAEGDPGEGWSWAAGAWADRVEDYIRRDRARGEAGVLVADRATVYHPGEALLAGATLRGEATATTWLGFSGDAAWTWGEDRDSGLPLPQIPPLSGAAAVRVGPHYLFGRATVRWSARATRVDDDPATGSAQDAGETPVWAVLDLALTWIPHPDTELAVGLDNAFDRTYAEHLNKPSAFDTTVTRVNEPGLNAWVSGSARF